MVIRTGEWEISAVSWRLLDNPGELACMTYMYFIKSSEHLAKKLIRDTKEKFLSTNTLGCRPNLKPNPPPSPPSWISHLKKKKKK